MPGRDAPPGRLYKRRPFSRQSTKHSENKEQRERRAEIMQSRDLRRGVVWGGGLILFGVLLLLEAGKEP